MKKATTLLQLDSEEEASNDSDFEEDDLSVRSDDLDLQLSDYDGDAQEVSSGKFDARHVKKYATPETFKHVLWNTAGPSVVAMQICLEIIKEELAGQIAGVPAEFRDLPEQLISFMYKEAGEDLHKAIAFISQIHEQIGKYDNDKEAGNSESHVKTITYDEIKPAPDIPPTKDRGTQEASKTQGPLPGAQQTSPAEGTVIEPATEAGGDKEGHGGRWIAMDDPLLLLQSMEGEHHQLRQTVPPVLLDDGALQNGQPTIGTTSPYYGHSALRGSH
jgi:hypothetical protein